MICRAFLLVPALIFSLCFSAVAFAAEKLPPGFSASAPGEMKWSDAKAFCASKGGKLPLIGDKNKLPSKEVTAGIPIDGFGSRGAKWPSGLPDGRFWTGAERGNAGDAWYVTDKEGNVYVNSADQGNTFRVFCVPK